MYRLRTFAQYQIKHSLCSKIVTEQARSSLGTLENLPGNYTRLIRKRDCPENEHNILGRKKKLPSFTEIVALLYKRTSMQWKKARTNTTIYPDLHMG